MPLATLKSLNLGDIEQESEALAVKLQALEKQREELLALVKGGKKVEAGEGSGNSKLLQLENADLKS